MNQNLIINIVSAEQVSDHILRLRFDDGTSQTANFNLYGLDSPPLGAYTLLAAADFRLGDEKSGIGALLDSVANQQHRRLRDKALRNLGSVTEAVPNHATKDCAALVDAAPNE